MVELAETTTRYVQSRPSSRTDASLNIIGCLLFYIVVFGLSLAFRGQASFFTTPALVVVCSLCTGIIFALTTREDSGTRTVPAHALPLISRRRTILYFAVFSLLWLGPFVIILALGQSSLHTTLFHRNPTDFPFAGNRRETTIAELVALVIIAGLHLRTAWLCFEERRVCLPLLRERPKSSTIPRPSLSINNQNGRDPTTNVENPLAVENSDGRDP